MRPPAWTHPRPRPTIFVKPTRQIKYIKLNFIKVKTGVTFDEVVGKI